MDRLKIGKFGEDIAYKYLISLGYEILVRNYRERFGEIDLIGREVVIGLGRALIFFEVKTIIKSIEAKNDIFYPEYNLTTQKLYKVKRIAQFFSSRYPNFVSQEIGWRIDLIAVDVFKEDLSFSIRHYKNI